MKRFYKFVVLKKKSNSSFQVILDDRPIQTPKRKIINLPNRKLANALAREWKNQKQDILLEKMPITQLLFMAYDYISVKKIRFITEILKMYETDLVFYWAEDSDELLKRQQKTWLPLIDWAEKRYKIDCKYAKGIMPIVQPKRSIKMLKTVLNELDLLVLTAVYRCLKLSKSLLLPLAMAEDFINFKVATKVFFLDEDYQSERWGKDKIQTLREKDIEKELKDTYSFMRLCKVS
jgi:chaperone required for assembly of F1-ATPase|tara:strand:- start:446 stop:1147 length:702 start_codon:yes stop_codon:yes gene_type:complete